MSQFTPMSDEGPDHPVEFTTGVHLESPGESTLEEVQYEIQGVNWDGEFSIGFKNSGGEDVLTDIIPESVYSEITPLVKSNLDLERVKDEVATTGIVRLGECELHRKSDTEVEVTVRLHPPDDANASLIRRSFR